MSFNYIQRVEIMKKINNKKQFTIILCILLVILFLLIIFSVTIGSANISPLDSFAILIKRIPIIGNNIDISNIQNSSILIIEKIRLPRILLAGIIGFSLASCGNIYQGVLKNYMADPYILGVSSGAALGATISIIGNGFLSVRLLAFIFAIISTLIVYFISRKNAKNNTHLILAGININYFFTALISLLMLLNKDKLDKIFYWTMGSLTASSWSNVMISFFTIIPLIIIMSVLGKYINAITINEDFAKSVGINTILLRKLLILIISFITAICVSSSGTIGFVGLMIPHIVKVIFGDDYRFSIILSGIVGSIFLIICDNIAKTILSPTEIPIGIITSCIGSPYLIYLLFKYNKGVNR